MKEKERDSQASKIHRGRNEVKRSMRGGGEITKERRGHW